jgi:hypothetical protein
MACEAGDFTIIILERQTLGFFECHANRGVQVNSSQTLLHRSYLFIQIDDFGSRLSAAAEALTAP